MSSFVYADQYREVASDIYVIDMLTPEACRALTEKSDAVGGYASLPQDVKQNAAPGQENRLHNIDMDFVKEYDVYWKTHLIHIVKQIWWPVRLHAKSHRMPFIIKYDPEIQPSLAPHHDSSTLSFACRLSDDYDGGYLTFPRQRWDNRDLRIGQACVFPGTVSHVHSSSAVTRGVKYSMTGWMVAKDHDDYDDLVSIHIK